MPRWTRYAQGADKPHYLVSEIFLRVDNPDQDADGAEGCAGLSRTSCSSGGNFAMVAHQFSQIALGGSRRRYRLGL